MGMQVKSRVLIAWAIMAVLFWAATDSRATEEGTISVTVDAGAYEIQETPQGHRVLAAEFGRIGIPGKPDLPAKIFALAIPPGAEVLDVTFEAVKEIPLSGRFKIPPASLPRVIGPEDPEVFAGEKRRFEANYESVYGQDQPYPAGAGRFVRTAVYRR